MARYLISVSVSAKRIEQPAHKLGDETIHLDPSLQAMMNVALKASGQPPVFVAQLGMQMEKTIQVSAESFAAIAEILGRFDRLSEEIECVEA
jgi:hypothetical protein